MSRLARSSGAIAQLLRQRFDLLLRLLKRSRCVDLIGRVLEFLVRGHLQGDAAARLGFLQAAGNEAVQLLGGCAPDNDETVQTFVHSRFDQQGGFDKYGIGDSLPAPRFKLIVHRRFDFGMKNRIQLCELCGVGKNDGAEPLAVNQIVRRQNRGAEKIDDFRISRFAGLYQFVAERISVENAEAESAQFVRDPRFAAGDSSGETEFEHRKKNGSKDPPLQRRLCGRFGATEASGFDGVGHKHGDGHGADAAGNGSERACRVDGVGMNVANQNGAFLAEFREALREILEQRFRFHGIGDFVGTDVNDSGSSFEPIGLDVARFAHRGDDDVRAANHVGKIFCF